jgi:hypothetical protein
VSCQRTAGRIVDVVLGREQLGFIQEGHVSWCEIANQILWSQNHDEMRRQRKDNRVRVPNGTIHRLQLPVLESDRHSG